jgi:tRNA pseudouridine55 synthase
MQANLWLNINKPANFSSAKVVSIIKKITKAQKVGHAGTLDPLATGVLPIAINKATKTAQYITDHDKKYYFEITWGEFRDTDDAQGKVIKSSILRPKTAQIIALLPKFIGLIKQVPPQFSAVKVNGRKAYQSARNNEFIELKPRAVAITQIQLLENNAYYAAFEISCSKGTYIRSFAKDLALDLGVCGYISVLKRLKVGSFLIEDTISLDKLKNIVNYGTLGDLLPLRDVLNFICEVELDDYDALKIKNGQIIQFNQNALKSDTEILVQIINNGEIIGLGKYGENKLRPINIF